MKSIYSPDYRALLTWLRDCRTRQKLSMRDLARKMGTTHSWIGKVETGERRLDITEYVRLCHALGVNAKHGINIIEDAMPPYPIAANDPLPKAAERKTGRVSPLSLNETAIPYRIRRQHPTLGS